MTQTIAESVVVLQQQAAELYRKRGFQTRVGYGQRPAVVVIDYANAWTNPKYKLGADLTKAVLATREVLDVARGKGVPIFFTTTAYDPSFKDSVLWLKKLPALAESTVGSEAAQIDARLARRPDEVLITKKYASAFFGTNFAGMLQSLHVDTLIITGCSTSACVRHTAEDGLGYGFHTILPRECIGDRAAGPHEWNLFDIDAKFGDVVRKEEVVRYLRSLPVTATRETSAVAPVLVARRRRRVSR